MDNIVQNFVNIMSDLWLNLPRPEKFDKLTLELILALDDLFDNPDFKLEETLGIEVFNFIKIYTRAFKEEQDRIVGFNEDIYHCPAGTRGNIQEFHLNYGILENNALTYKLLIKLDFKTSSIKEIHFFTNAYRLKIGFYQGVCPEPNSFYELKAFLTFKDVLYYICITPLANR